MNVLISGASIAGPALAYWLRRYGHEVTVVEIAPELRTGGNAVDFRGALHLGVLEQMGIVGKLRAVETGGTAMRFVSGSGELQMEWPADFAGGDLEVQRGDLARAIVAATPGVTWMFGDSVASLDECDDRVDVVFRSGLARSYDLVIGADGVHSTVRRLAFGPESAFVKHLGYYVAGWDLPNEWGFDRTTVMHNTPGRMAGVGGDHRDPALAHAFFCFRSDVLTYDRHNRAEIRALLRARYAGMGWETQHLLDRMDEAPDLWFDQICRVDNPTWSKGRIALVGDAACGATIGGQGNGTAIVSAYVLAGELALAGNDYRVAFAAYEERLGKFARGTQKGGDTTGMFLAPKTARGIRARNWMNNQAWFLNLTRKIAADRSTALDLPAYPAPTVPAGSSPAAV